MSSFGLLKKKAIHLSRDTLKDFYVNNSLLSPKLKAIKMLDFKGCPALRSQS